MKSAPCVQILDEIIFDSVRAEALDKGVRPSILPTAMGKPRNTLGSLALVRQPVWAKKNSKFKPLYTA